MAHPIPLSVIRDLRCTHCQKFTSCGPVHVVPNGGILCGRCRMLAKPKYRNYAYEALAKNFLFPCCNWSKYCPKQLKWDECVDHERNCSYTGCCSLLCTSFGAAFKSERKPPETEEINLEHLTEEVLDILKCASCENYLSCDPVHIGNDGKNICHRCVTSNGVPKGCIRNLAYEKLASIFIFPCIYRFRGCTIRLRYGRDLWNHEVECSYAQVYKKVSKKPSKNGKEKGVIETHSGHYYGTITPHSALFAPPKAKVRDSAQELNQEIVKSLKKKGIGSTSEEGDFRREDVDGDSLAPSRDSTMTRDSMSLASMGSMGSMGGSHRNSLNYGYQNLSRPSLRNSRPPTREDRRSSNDNSLNDLDEEMFYDARNSPASSVIQKGPSPSGHPPNSPSPNGQPSPIPHPQNSFPLNVQSLHPQSSHPPNGYPQNGHPQNGYLQNSHPQNGYPQSGYPQNGYPQNSHPQQAYPANYAHGLPPNYAQNYPQSPGYRPQSFPQGHPQYDSTLVREHVFQLPHYEGGMPVPPPPPTREVPKRSESLKVGNSAIIAEIKARQLAKQKAEEAAAEKKEREKQAANEHNPFDNFNNLQDIVQHYDEVFDE